MVQVRIAGVARDAVGQHLILLKPIGAGSETVLPIWIGGQEASSILIAVEGAQAARPLSHDLMKSLLEAVGATVERVEVTKIEDNTFYAEITLQTPRGRLAIDARPSDAVALASRVDAPIWVADDVLAAAGVPDELTGEVPDEEAKVAEFRQFLDEAEPEDFAG
jgi:bifunctional DNase/RNase